MHNIRYLLDPIPIHQRSSSQSPCPSTPPTPSPKPTISSPKPKLRADNRHSENIGERCRPSSIAVAYTTLESQQWMDAKEAMEDKGMEEDDIVKFLCHLIMVNLLIVQCRILIFTNVMIWCHVIIIVGLST